MANQFFDKRWELGTANTTAKLLGITHMISIARIWWKPAADGNTLLIQDSDGNDVHADEATGAWPDETSGGVKEHDFRFDPPLRMKGMILHTLGGGNVIIELAG